jgi:tetratricopeptide (TPR) repeat protein
MSNASLDFKRHIASGERLVDAERYAEALAAFSAAWNALPDPKEEQAEAISILAAIGDCCFFLGRWEDCGNAIQHSFRCGADLSNPFLRLRLGQSLFELGDLNESANWLVPVYLMEGRAPFAGEDPKYLESFRSQLQPPEDGWPEGW